MCTHRSLVAHLAETIVKADIAAALQQRASMPVLPLTAESLLLTALSYADADGLSA
jgi:hypothetical protein